MSLNRNSSVPLHLQAEKVLRELATSDEYKTGKLLPTEVELSTQLHISRNTLRQAIDRLVSEGILERKKGLGTWVSRKGINVGVQNWLSFSQEMKLLGVTVKNYELHLSYQTPTQEIAEFFAIRPNDKCLTLRRLRGNTDGPFVLFISYFNPALPLTGDENYMMPLYEMLEDECNIVVKTSKEEISARRAGETIAKQLEIAMDDPILIRKRFVYDEKGLPIEYNIGYYRSDSFTYTIESVR